MADDHTIPKTYEAWLQATNNKPKDHKPEAKPDRSADMAKHAPEAKRTYEMPGPLGNEVRRTTFVSAQERVKRSEERKAEQTQSKKPENSRANSQKSEKARVPEPIMPKFNNADERNR